MAEQGLAALLEEGKKVNRSEKTRKDIRRKLHQTLRAVTHDFEEFEFNTIISAQMELMNDLIEYKNEGGWGTDEWKEAVDIYVRMMAPITPHICRRVVGAIGETIFGASAGLARSG